MKKNSISLASICLLTASAFADFFVVTPDQVSVTHEGLFVTIEGLPMAVDSLNMSNNGYIIAISAPNVDICPRCGHDTYTQMS